MQIKDQKLIDNLNKYECTLHQIWFINPTVTLETHVALLSMSTLFTYMHTFFNKYYTNVLTLCKRSKNFNNSTYFSFFWHYESKYNN